MNKKKSPILNNKEPDLPIHIAELIAKLKISDVMNRNIIWSKKSDSLKSIQKKMKDKKISGIPILHQKRIIGIVSIDDIINALENGYINEPCEKYMTTGVVVLEDEMPLSIGVSYLSKYTFNRFPVINKDGDIVGIFTDRDILSSVIIELNKEVTNTDSPTETNRNIEGTLYKTYPTKQFDFENAGIHSISIKKELIEKNIPQKIIRRVSVAAYELEMNQVVHSNGGSISISMDKNQIFLNANDLGPGIEDVSKALEEGFSTAKDWIRSLGFGAGMGLPNTKRASDEFSITSSKDGTNVEAIFYIEAKDEN